tara:strand:- start:508 stop:1005 length:498 start_codon:yes stop_codon:yes gene_type:complete
MQGIIPSHIVDNYIDGGCFRRPSVDDIEYLSENLRPEDKDEIKAASGLDPKSGITQAVSLKDTWIGAHDHGPWLIFGHIVIKPSQATLWCLCTTHISQHRVPFLRLSPYWINFLGSKFQSLNCFTDSRNEEHHRWLRYVRFKRIGDPFFFYDPNVEFHEYKREDF